MNASICLLGLSFAAASAALSSSAAAQVCFQQGHLGAVETGPRSLTSADLDGDGDADFACVSTGAAGPGISYASIVRNRGDGTFDAPVEYPVAANPQDVASADLDGDGDVDLVAGCQGGMVVLSNFGDGTFAASVSYSVQGASRGLAIADLDADGDLDVFNGTDGPWHQVAVFKNHGDGTFAPAVYSPGESGPLAVVAADLDGDGDVDAVSANYWWAWPFEISTVSVFLNAGDGTLAPQVLYAVPSSPSSIVAADLDGDGDLDLATAHFYPESVTILLNDGTGVLTSSAPYPAGVRLDSLTSGDLDGDGDFDLAASSGSSPRVVVLENAGNGTFGAPLSFPTGSVPESIERADVDGDGDLDLAVVTTLPSTFAVLSSCRASGQAFCVGDGSGTPCPCGNASAPGANAGCTTSLGQGATLRGAGATRLAADGLELRADSMTGPFALFFQGTSASNGGAGAPFGDGLRCAGGSLIRLGAEDCVAGAAHYPGPGDVPVSVQGAVAAPGRRYYQAWYRNAAAWCTPATFNLTNGLAVDWIP